MSGRQHMCLLLGYSTACSSSIMLISLTQRTLRVETRTTYRASGHVHVRHSMFRVITVVHLVVRVDMTGE